MKNFQPLQLLAAILVAASANGASAATYVEIFNEAAAANGDSSLTFLDTVATDGTTAYAVLRDAGTARLWVA